MDHIQVTPIETEYAGLVVGGGQHSEEQTNVLSVEGLEWNVGLVEVTITVNVMLAVIGTDARMDADNDNSSLIVHGCF